MNVACSFPALRSSKVESQHCERLQTILQHVKCGELEAVHVRRGRRKGLRIKVIDTHPVFFMTHHESEVYCEESSKNELRSRELDGCQTQLLLHTIQDCLDNLRCAF